MHARISRIYTNKNVRTLPSFLLLYLVKSSRKNLEKLLFFYVLVIDSFVLVDQQPLSSILRKHIQS